ncbi:MAG: hypothetical protein V2B18_21750 [Pseudomonadota bacterium]
MKRWLWILAMAPVMFGLFQLVCWADCLHAWQYSPKYDPPTTVDYVRAAIVFWGALLTPVCVGLVTAVVAFRKQYPARWPFGGMCIVVLPMLVLYGGVIWPFDDNSFVGRILWFILSYSNFIAGGAIVMGLLNLGACIRHRKWGKLTLSALAFCVGWLYLFWLYAFIIYIDT